jgi:hypothetical protein
MVFEREYDVLIGGGGVAGVAAAVQCARAGLKTALVEKTILVGGLATAGLVNWYVPLCDGHGHQVTFGIAEEFLHASLKYGPGQVPAGWYDPSLGAKGRMRRYNALFSPASLVMGLDELLDECGVSVWLDTLITEPIMQGDRVRGVVVETKGGRGLLRARCLVDATGDADIATRAGAEIYETDNWLGYDVIESSFDASAAALAHRDPLYLTNPNHLARLSSLEMVRVASHGPTEVHYRKSQPAGVEKIRANSAENVTKFVTVGRRVLREHYKALYASGGEFTRQERFAVTLPTLPQFRTTRRIVGQETMSEGDANRKIATSVGLIADWYRMGSVWEIPYGTLIPRKITGLLAVGRCMESGAAWEITRVIPCCVLTGQVAGIAAQLAIQNHTTPDRLDAGDVQKRLGQMGIPFHVEQVVSGPYQVEEDSFDGGGH